MTDALIEAAKQVPAMVVLVAIVWLFLAAEDKRDAQRVANAKQLEQERSINAQRLEEARQKHESEMNAMWASHIKSLVETQREIYKAIADTLSDHEKASQERYEKMGITKDLLDVARKQFKP